MYFYDDEVFRAAFLKRFSDHSDLYVRVLKFVRTHRSVISWFWFCFFSFGLVRVYDFQIFQSSEGCSVAQ